MRHQTNFSTYNGLEVQQFSRLTGMHYSIYQTQSDIEKPFLISSTFADKLTKAIGLVALFSALFLIGFSA